MPSASTPVYAAGDLVIRRIVEMEAPFMPALEMLPGLTVSVLEQERASLFPDYLDADDVFKFAFQSFIVETPHHTILVDSCLGNHKDRDGARWHMKSDATYLAGLAAHGLSVDDIDFVMCTHLHFDHVGWNTRLENGAWVPTFPKAKYIFGRQDFDDVLEGRTKLSLTAFADSVLPIANAGRAELVDNDFTIGDHVRVLPTPGHTAGHMSFCFGKRADEVVMSGDVLHVPLQVKYPELSFVKDHDPAQAAVTRRSFLERYSGTRTLCCMSHFTRGPVGRVANGRHGFEFRAVEAV